MLLSFALNAWSLSEAGYGNTYYAAAVRSMTMSWKNFFFGAFDPGGFVTVDKAPGFLWVEALSARVFGYSTWSIMLPSAVAGAASAGLLWLIVRRWFGVTAATIAGLVLALSPISVAVNRLNSPEPFLVLALIGAAGSVMRSLESRRWWAWTALAGFLVGVAFNTKMLAGWIPGPALALALVVAVPTISRTSARRLLGRLAVLAAVTLAVSASWMLAVDAWPASDRPYIGGSTDNTVLDLALGYNGFGRVDGEDQGGGGPRTGVNPGQTQRPLPGLDGGIAPGGPGVPPGGQPPSGQAVPGGPQGAGGVIAGTPGLLRMFDDANGGQTGWLLPFALGAGLVALWHWRRDRVRRSFALLFLGWVLLYAGIFSFAEGIYHSYYTAALAPGVAALAGVGTVALAKAARRDPRWLIVAAALVGLTVWTQLQIAGRAPDYYGWIRPLTVATAAAGLGLAVVLAARRLSALGGLALSLAGLLLLPGAWSLSEATNAPLDIMLPQAGPRQGVSGQAFGSGAFGNGASELAAWLKSHSDPNARWQLVVYNAQSASRLIAEDELSVMALGGFLGTDNTISVAGFAGLVSSGDVRYVEAGQGRGPRAGFGPPAGPGGRDGVLFPRDGATGQPAAPGAGGIGVGAAPTSGAGAVMSAVQSACAAVSDPSLPATYQGVIYDCAGRAGEILTQAS